MTAQALSADLVLEGGGVKGTALVGAAAALEAAGYRFNRIAGTSSGAIAGALLAAGIPAARLHQLLLDTEYRTLLDPTTLKALPVPFLDDALSELFDQGLYRGDALQRFMADQLAAAGVRTFADLRLPGTDVQANVPIERRYRLVVVASDLTRQRMVRIPWYMEREYGLDPDSVSVADAVRMSTAIPFFYLPFRLRSQLTGEVSLMVDGGVNSNFPVDIFDDGAAPAPTPTFYVGVMTAPPPTARMPEPSNPVAYIRAIILTGINGRDNADLDAPSVRGRGIFIDTSYVSATDFSIDRQTRERLYQDGFDAAERFLSSPPGAGPAAAPPR